MKRMVSAVMAVVLAIGMMPLPAYAQGGAGSSSFAAAGLGVAEGVGGDEGDGSNGEEGDGSDREKDGGSTDSPDGEKDKGSSEGSNKGSSEGSDNGSSEGSDGGSSEGSDEGSGDGSGEGSNEGSGDGSGDGSNEGSGDLYTKLDASGSCGDNTTYTFDAETGALSIEVADSEQYASIDSGIIAGNPDIVTATVGEGITYVQGLFQGCKNLTTVDLPKTLDHIGRYTFYGCDKLATVNFAGTSSYWTEQLGIDAWNDSLGQAKITCADGVVVSYEPPARVAYTADDIERIEFYNPRPLIAGIDDLLQYGLAGKFTMNDGETYDLDFGYELLYDNDDPYGGVTRQVRECLRGDFFGGYTTDEIDGDSVVASTYHAPALTVSVGAWDRSEPAPVTATITLSESLSGVHYNNSVEIAVIENPVTSLSVSADPYIAKSQLHPSYENPHAMEAIEALRALDVTVHYKDGQSASLSDMRGSSNSIGTAWSDDPDRTVFSGSVFDPRVMEAEPADLYYGASRNEVCYTSSQNLDRLEAGQTYVFTVSYLGAEVTASLYVEGAFDDSLLESTSGIASENIVNVGVGDVEQLESNDSAETYGNGTDRLWVYTDESAVNGIAFTFSDDSTTEYLCDYVCIYDKDDVLVAKLSGAQLAAWSGYVAGNTLKIRLTTDASATHRGFKVSDMKAYGEGEGAPRSIDDISSDLTLDAFACVVGSLPRILGMNELGTPETPFREGVDYTTRLRRYVDTGGADMQDVDYDALWQFVEDTDVAGRYQLLVIGKNGYYGRTAFEFEAVPANNIKLAEWSYQQYQKPSDAPYVPAIEVRMGGKLLEEGTDYTVALHRQENRQPLVNGITTTGSYYAIVTGIGSYEGTGRCNFLVADAIDIGSLSIDGFVEEVNVNEPWQEFWVPYVTVSGFVDGNFLSVFESSDGISVAFEDEGGARLDQAPNEVGSYRILIEGVGRYGGTIEQAFKIVDLRPVTWLDSSVADNGAYAVGAVPELVMTDPGRGRVLDEGTDYTAVLMGVDEFGETFDLDDGARPDALGSYCWVVTGEGSYTSELRIMFDVVEANDIRRATLTYSEEQPISDTVYQPAIEVRMGDAVLEIGTDYTVTYLYQEYGEERQERVDGLSKSGSYVALIEGAGVYAGERCISFEMVEPLEVSGLTLDFPEEVSVYEVDPPLEGGGSPVWPHRRRRDAGFQRGWLARRVVPRFFRCCSRRGAGRRRHV